MNLRLHRRLANTLLRVACFNKLNDQVRGVRYGQRTVKYIVSLFNFFYLIFTYYTVVTLYACSQWLLTGLLRVMCQFEGDSTQICSIFSANQRARTPIKLSIVFKFSIVDFYDIKTVALKRLSMFITKTIFVSKHDKFASFIKAGYLLVYLLNYS